MNIQRRRFLQLSTLAAALPATSRLARAEAYPSHPVHIVLGFPPGGSSDVIGRLMAQSLAEKLGKPFVFDNKPGAGGNIGTEWVAKAAPDGYTLLWSTSANAVNASLYHKLNFDFLKDFESGAGVFQIPNVMEVNPVDSSQKRPGIHRLRQGQSRQDQLRFGRLRDNLTHGG